MNTTPITGTIHDDDALRSALPSLPVDRFDDLLTVMHGRRMQLTDPTGPLYRLSEAAASLPQAERELLESLGLIAESPSEPPAGTKEGQVVSTPA